MLNIVGRRGDPRKEGCPGPALSLDIKLPRVADPVTMIVEPVNDCTRVHPESTNPEFRMFHIMVFHPSTEAQFAICFEIAKDPGRFYNQLVTENASAEAGSPLTLFTDTGVPPHNWRPVRYALLHALDSMRDSLRRLEALPDPGTGDPSPIPTPCYGLLTSAFPGTYVLMDAVITAVVHP